MSVQKAFTEDASYMERHKMWLTQDDHLFLIPEPLTIYTSLPMTEKTIKHYNDCFPDVELTINFALDQEELNLYKGEGNDEGKHGRVLLPKVFREGKFAGI